MIFIDKDDSNIQLAKIKHLKFYNCRVIKKLINASCLNQNCPVCMSTSPHSFRSGPGIVDNIVDFLYYKDNIEKILVGLPDIIYVLSGDFFSYVLPASDYSNLDSYLKETKKKKEQPLYKVIHDLIKDVSSIFNYKDFTAKDSNDEYSGYHLAANLNRRSCIYCNRIYTTTITTGKGGKLMRPQFDHWFSHSKYPLLSISFFNLIPSCYSCNSSVKRDIELNLKDHVHPYVDKNQTDAFSFYYFYSLKLDKYRIFITPVDSTDKRAFSTLKKLKVDDMYNAHHEELKDLIKLKQAYSETYLEKIQSLFPKTVLAPQEVYRLLFGTEWETKNFHSRPMSKFKKDILKQLEIID